MLCDTYTAGANMYLTRRIYTLYTSYTYMPYARLTHEYIVTGAATVRLSATGSS